MRRGVLALLVWLGALPTAAQVILDGSFGAVGALLPDAAHDVAIPETVGGRAGANLFHSFSELSVPPGTSATFSAETPGIERVLARVTGGSVSRIDGLLRSRIPGADLYLLNPHGVLFGRGAQLDLPGSLYLGGAESLVLADGVRLWGDPSRPVVLSSAPPSAWGFGAQPAAAIEIRGSALSLAEDTTLSLAGSEIDITGREPQPGESFGFRVLTAARARVELVAVAGAGDAALEPDGIDVSGIEQLGPVSISGWVQLDGTSRGASQLRVRADSLLFDRAFVFFDNIGAADQDHTGRALDLEARTRIEIRGESELTSEAYGAGRSGDVRLVAPEVILDGDSSVASVASGMGASGGVAVHASRLQVLGASALTSKTRAGGAAGDLLVNADAIRVEGADSVVGSVTESADGSATGDGGDVTVHAGTVELRDGGQILVRTRNSKGDAGRLSVSADRIEISGVSGLAAAGLFSTEEVCAADPCERKPAFPLGRGGDVEIEAGVLHVMDGGRITARSLAQGIGPRVGAPPELGIRAGTVQVVGSGRSSSGEAVNSAIQTRSADRDAGDLTLITDELELRGGGQISASTAGTGRAGNVIVQAERVLVTGRDPEGDESGIFSEATETSTGGSVSLAVRELELSDGGRITVATEGAGQAGRLTINDPTSPFAVEAWRREGRIVVSGATIRSSVVEKSPGATGGEVEIHARQLILGPGGSVEARNESLGDAGDVELHLVEALRIDGGKISTSAENGLGGNIAIHVGEIIEVVDGEITTSVGTGNGGNILIDPELVALTRSRIVAQAVAGAGGNIRIVAGHFVQSADSVVSASSQLGIDGTVVIDSPVEVLADEVAPLPDRVLDASDQLRRGCAARRTRAGSLTVASQVVRIGPEGVLGAEGEPGECPAR